MESFFSRYKNALVLIVVLLAQVIGVAIQVRRPLPREHAQPDAGGVRLIRYWAISLVSPPERLVHWLGASILGVWDNYIDLMHVRQQNKDLEAQLHRLRIEEGGIAEDARQGQRLQQLLAFKEKYVYQTQPAQIIGTSGTEQSRILSIDKGAKDGIAVDMPVITPDGIVGRVREVFPHTSQVLEITDPTSGAGVILSTTRIRGILRGNALGQPQVINVMPDERIKPGEQVVTSGGDQIFPRGLAVGVVDRVMVDPDHDPLVDVLIHPAANLAQLEEVLVITNMGDQVTPRQKLDMIQSEAASDAEQLKASEILAERLPSRIDPDAPVTDDENSASSPDAQGEDIGRPMRPPSALHPDRFTPNLTPAAASLMPGARLAPQSEGVLTSAVKPHTSTSTSTSASAASTGSGDTAQTVTPAPKKTPQLVPDDGSRPPAAMVAHTPATTSGTTSATRPTVNSASGATSSPARLAIPRPAAVSDNGNASSTSASTAAPKTDPLKTEPKTRVIVDGPLPSGAKKTPPAAATTQGQAQAQAPGQHAPSAAATTGAHPPATTPQHPSTTPPAQHKGPVLVPDDGSRPPPTMVPKPKPQTETQPQPPQGNR
jgi:rod shape-determining protein MreC